MSERMGQVREFVGRLERGAIDVAPTLGRGFGGAMALYGAGTSSPAEVVAGLALYTLSARATVWRDRRGSVKKDKRRVE